MWFYEEGCTIDEELQMELMERLVEEANKRINSSIKRVLLLPPDITRYHSGAGRLTNMLYHILGPNCKIDVIENNSERRFPLIIFNKITNNMLQLHLKKVNYLCSIQRTETRPRNGLLLIQQTLVVSGVRFLLTAL